MSLGQGGGWEGLGRGCEEGEGLGRVLGGQGMGKGGGGAGVCVCAQGQGPTFPKGGPRAPSYTCPPQPHPLPLLLPPPLPVLTPSLPPALPRKRSCSPGFKPHTGDWMKRKWSEGRGRLAVCVCAQCQGPTFPNPCPAPPSYTCPPQPHPLPSSFPPPFQS